MKNKILYKNFLEDNRIYSLAKSWWGREFRKQIMNKKSNSDNNKDNSKNSDLIFNWHNDSLKNKKEFRDGNPIFTVFSISKQKLVRIIQEKVENENNQDFIQISAWLDKGFYPREETPELVISLELSRLSAKIAFNWIKKWFNDNLNDRDLEIDFDERNSISI